MAGTEYNVSSVGIDSVNLADLLPCDSCALLYEGIEGQAVALALRLMGVVLVGNSAYRNTHGLLICRRTAWEEAVKLQSRRLFSAFKSSEFPCADCTLELGTKLQTLEALLNHCFVTCRHGKDVGVASGPAESTQSQPDSLETVRQDTIDALVKLLDAELTNDATSSSQLKTDEMGLLGDFKVEDLNRLLVRFVDEVPMRRLQNGCREICAEPFNTFVLHDEQIWNFMQVANEIANYSDEAIGLVIVAGLAQMQINATEAQGHFITSNYSHLLNSSIKLTPKDLQNITIPHPFTASAVVKRGDENDQRMYRHKYLNSYALCISTLLNSISAKIANNDQQLPLPQLFLFESLPREPQDRDKFISFLSCRFNRVAVVNY